MRKKMAKKLTLEKDTLARLANPEHAAGGDIYNTKSCQPPLGLCGSGAVTCTTCSPHTCGTNLC